MNNTYPKALLVVIFSMISVLAFGQATPPSPAPTSPVTYGLSGRLTDSTAAETLVGIAVQLWSLPDSTLKVAITNVEGKFAFKDLKPGLYRIVAKYIGYRDLRRRVRLSPEAPYRDLGVLKMSTKPELTTEIEIIGERLAVQQKGDTTQFDAASYKVNRDATAEDLIQKMPGISSDGGTLKAQGENVKRVLVDGKPFFGDDPNAAVKNLPADLIDKVEVFDQKSEASQFSGFNDGNTNKTLNFITKSGMRNGMFGSASAGYGKDNGDIPNGADRYKVAGSINRFAGDQRLTVLVNLNNINEQNFSIDDILGATGSGGGRGMGAMMMMRGMMGGRMGGGGGGRGGSGGIGDFLVQPNNGITNTWSAGLNYTDNWGKKITTTLSYFANRGITAAETFTDRQFFSTSDTAQRYNERNTSTSTNTNHRFNMRLEYKPTPNYSILFIPRYTIQLNDGQNNILGGTNLGDAILSNTANQFGSNLTGYSLNNDLMLRHRFEKAGRTVSLGFNNVINNNDGNSTLFASNSYLRAGRLGYDTSYQSSNIVKRGTTWGTTLEYTEPITSKVQLSSSYNLSSQITDSDRRTNSLKAATLGEQYDSLSNKFKSTYVTHRGNVGLLYNTDKANLTVNLAYQVATLDNNQTFPQTLTTSRTFDNFLPSAFFTYKFDNKRSMRLVYNTSTNAPSIDQLQNVVNNNNPLQLSSGNPNLQQDYSHRMIARYSSTNPEANSNFFAFVMGSVSQNYVASSTTIARRPDTLDNGVVLTPGSQYTRPVNVNGYWTVNSFVNYGFPIKFIKSNLNVGGNAMITNTPGIINDQTNEARSYTTGATMTIGSNISENVDFTISTMPSYNTVVNTLPTSPNTSFFSQNSNVRLNYVIWKGITFNTTLRYQYYNGLSQGFNQNFWLWNMSVGKRIFKNEAGEIKLSVFDQLGQNQSVSRTSNEAYIEDTRTLVLQRYYMVTFSYRLRQFKAPEKPMGMPFMFGG